MIDANIIGRPRNTKISAMYGNINGNPLSHVIDFQSHTAYGSEDYFCLLEQYVADFLFKGTNGIMIYRK